MTDNRMLAISDPNAPLKVMWDTGRNTTLELRALEAMCKDRRSWMNFLIMSLGGPPALMTAKQGDKIVRFRVTFPGRGPMNANYETAY